jgi:NAD(P)-dependent dehydrogenase (short-subunit alcohol dehydrogenase family)
MHTALVTGASAGLGRALASELARLGWRVVVDARGGDSLREAAARITGEAGSGEIVAVPGDVTDPDHRRSLADVVNGSGLELLVHNASTLGEGGLRPLADLPAAELRAILETNVVAPVALTALLLPALRRAHGAILTISSDAAVEHYERWGGYGASKAALDHVAGTFAAEHAEVAAYAVDPGDMRTAMHQAAFPGEDISDRPLPETVVAPILRLIDARPPSGRYRAGDLASLGSPVTAPQQRQAETSESAGVPA